MTLGFVLAQEKTCRFNNVFGTYNVAQLAGEYGFVMKQLGQLERGEEHAMRAVAASYRHPMGKKSIDARLGEGAGEFLARVLEAMFGAETNGAKG